MKDPDCERCKLADEDQFFTATINDQQYGWIVSKAILFVRSRPHDWDEIPGDAVAEILSCNEWDPAHIDHVDPAVFGISVPLYVEGEERYYVIDGLHRAARCVRDGRPFRVYLLSREEAEECLVIRPDGVVDLTKLDPRQRKAVMDAVVASNPEARALWEELEK